MSLSKTQTPYADPREVNKVLFLKYDKIGDMVVCTPVFRVLKQAFPHVEINVLASSANKNIIKHNPYVNRIYTYSNNWLKLLPLLLKLRKEKYDICFEFEASVVTRAILITKIVKPKFVASTYKRLGRYGIDPKKLRVYDFYTT